jgi:hypothetical protein
MLRRNVADMDDVHAIQAMAGDGSATTPSLVRTHAGSASPRGEDHVEASTLDRLVDGAAPIDVIKVDTDGYDGHVLKGARRTLERDEPVVQFEWHPALAQAAGVEVDMPFSILSEAGYDTFVWFDKYGNFWRVEHAVDCATIQRRAEWCASSEAPAPDWHYDVIAVGPRDESLAPALKTPTDASRS